MNEKALEALHVAADAIRGMADVREATADNDHKTGEVIFVLLNGEQYHLSLSKLGG